MQTMSGYFAFWYKSAADVFNSSLTVRVIIRLRVNIKILKDLRANIRLCACSCVSSALCEQSDVK